jgi:hypothetical protein
MITNNDMTNYYWVRIFRKNKENTDSVMVSPPDYTCDMLDEYYLYGENLTRENAKKQVTDKHGKIPFAKPKGDKCGIYAVIMDSDKSYYDYFAREIDTVCFDCHKPIKGIAKYYPKAMLQESEQWVYFCSYDCKKHTLDKLNCDEGEWQERTSKLKDKGIIGYIYHIYNRITKQHYIGQSKYLPFFRWQEHAKQGIKGDLCDLVFETITAVYGGQTELNDLESWWIHKFIDEYGKDNVMNMTVPKITEQDLVQAYETALLNTNFANTTLIERTTQI